MVSDDEIFIVNDDILPALPVNRRPGQCGDVINLSDEDDDDIEVLQSANTPAQGEQEDAKASSAGRCSMDCCRAAVELDKVVARTHQAGKGESLIDICTALSCPSCNNTLSIRDIDAALGTGGGAPSRNEIISKLQQLAVESLKSSDTTNAMAKMLKGEVSVGSAWLRDGWFLTDQALSQIRKMLRSRGLSAQGDKPTCIERLLQHDDVKRALPQIAASLGLMGTILHLRLLTLGRLPDENYVTSATQPAEASTSEKADQSLYCLSRIGSLAPAAAAVAAGSTADNTSHSRKKRLAEGTGDVDCKPAGKKTKKGTANASSQPDQPASSAAVASGVGYRGSKTGGFSAMHNLMTAMMQTSASYMPNLFGPQGIPPFMAGPMPSILPSALVPSGPPMPPPPPGLPSLENVASTSMPNPAAATKSAVASGVGYGGGEHAHASHYSSYTSYKQYKKYQKEQQLQQQKKQQVNQVHAKLQQEKAQKEKEVCIRAIARLLKASSTNPVIGPMPAPLAVMLHGGLASVLHDLLEDSIDALLDDVAVQRPLLTLLEQLCPHSSLLPVLTAKGSWPKHLLPSGDKAAEDTAGPSGTSIADRLSSMRAGCELWQREGQRMLDNEDQAGPSNAAERDPADDIALVLHASNTGDRVRAAIVASAHYQEVHVPTQAPVATDGARQTCGHALSRSKKRVAEGGSGAAHNDQEVVDAAVRERHTAAMHQHAFFQAPLEENHAYLQEASQASHQNASHAQRNKTIMKQLTSLSASLPAHFDSSVHVAVATVRTDMARVLILAGKDTPYAFGAFVFDVFFPLTFPNHPPKMQFLTTGGGRVRFNPNLYKCGKVCLSLLGTWSGPSWSPANSTFLQVLVSLQAMVFCEHPYFNEPGYERTAGTISGDKQSEAYNAYLRAQTAAHGILDCLNNPKAHPHAVFSDVLDLHWRAKGPLLKEYLREHSVPRGKEIRKKIDALLAGKP